MVSSVVGRIEQAFFHVGLGDALDGVAELLGDELGGVGVDHVGDLRASGPASSGSGSRPRARSAMRFASSWMVIVSGMITSRAIFSFGSFCLVALQALDAAAERCDRAHALLLVSPSQSSPSGGRGSSPAGALAARGLGGVMTLVGMPGRRMTTRSASSSSSGARRDGGAGGRRAGAPGVGSRRCARGAGAVAAAVAQPALGFVLGLPAHFVVAAMASSSSRLRASAASRSTFSRASRSTRALASMLACCALPPRGGALRRAPRRGRPRSSSVSVRSTTPPGAGKACWRGGALLLRRRGAACARGRRRARRRARDGAGRRRGGRSRSGRRRRRRSQAHAPRACPRRDR